MNMNKDIMVQKYDTIQVIVNSVMMNGLAKRKMIKRKRKNKSTDTEDSDIDELTKHFKTIQINLAK